jgi:hypothetical protein
MLLANRAAQLHGPADSSNLCAGVILGPDGNLYGTTPFSRQTNAGVVFEIVVTVKRQRNGCWGKFYWQHRSLL